MTLTIQFISITFLLKNDDLTSTLIDFTALLMLKEFQTIFGKVFNSYLDAKYEDLLLDVPIHEQYAF